MLASEGRFPGRKLQSLSILKIAQFLSAFLEIGHLPAGFGFSPS
jgi:hypothetical protein